MKKLYALFVLFVLFAIQVQAAGIYTTVARGTVTQANMKISAVDGTAFVDFSAADVLTTKIGHLLVIRDSSGRAIQGFIKAAGTGALGDSLGSELIVNATFDDASWWTFEGNWSVADGVATSNGSYGAFYRLSTLSYRALYFYSMDVVSRISGGVSRPYDGNTTMYYLTTGTKTGYFTPIGSGLYINSSIFAGSVDNLSIKQVLAPSATGVTIVNTKGGSTFNFAQKNSLFKYNDSSGYTYEIYKVLNAPSVSTNTGLTAVNEHLATIDGGAFYFGSIDLTNYQDGRHMLWLKDTSGYVAFARIKSGAPSGEALGSEINTGTLTTGKVYKITATEANHFGTGRVIGSYFTSTGTETCDANNKVQEVTAIVSTGALLEKMAGTRNMIYKHASFNPNAISEIRVLHIGD